MPSENFVSTGQVRHLRACMICSIVKQQNDFINHGCPNCDDFLPSNLRFRNNPDAVRESTSQVFEGHCFVARPDQSWVARWQRLDNYVPGMYAVKVVGNLVPEVREALEDNGRKYIPRDGSGQDDEA